MSTKIEWTNEVWNPVTGCTSESAGCLNCYARRIAHRRMGEWKNRDFREVVCHEDRLGIPEGWKKPRMVFVNSMSDLFHETVPFEFVARVWDVMCRTPHTYQVLTKRPHRMIRFFEWLRSIVPFGTDGWMPKNVWLGVTCEDQYQADRRIPLLLQVQAAVRWVSVEPMLGPVDIRKYLPRWRCAHCGTEVYHHGLDLNKQVCGCGTGRGRWVVYGMAEDDSLHWVVCGGETGPGARRFEASWARGLRDQCKEVGTPFFFKKSGWNATDKYDSVEIKLDRKHTPSDLNIRQYPEAAL